MKSFPISCFIFLIFISLVPPCSALDANAGGEQGVTVEQNKTRMKATIPSETPASSGRKQNILYRGAGRAALGVYYAVKIPLDALGKGVDFSVQTVQKTSRKIFVWFSSRRSV